MTWLRETERKIQRDDPLKLEDSELQTGLKYLKVAISVKSLSRVMMYDLYHNFAVVEYMTSPHFSTFKFTSCNKILLYQWFPMRYIAKLANGYNVFHLGY